MWPGLQLTSSKRTAALESVGSAGAAGGRSPHARIALYIVSRRGEGARTEEFSLCVCVWFWAEPNRCQTGFSWVNTRMTRAGTRQHPDLFTPHRSPPASAGGWADFVKQEDSEPGAAGWIRVAPYSGFPSPAIKRKPPAVTLGSEAFVGANAVPRWSRGMNNAEQHIIQYL